MSLLQDYATYTSEERAQWIHMRGLEWFAWPAFICQSIVPALLAGFRSWWVIPAYCAVELAWRFFCHRFVSVTLAEIGIFVARLRWPASIASFIYLLMQGLYGLAVVALFWPLTATYLSVIFTSIARWLGTGADLVGVKVAFAEKLITLDDIKKDA